MLCCGYWPQDLKKDSNTQITLLGRIIDHAERILAARGMQLPKHLTVLTDNTCREGKTKML